MYNLCSFRFKGLVNHQWWLLHGLWDQLGQHDRVPGAVHHGAGQGLYHLAAQGSDGAGYSSVILEAGQCGEWAGFALHEPCPEDQRQPGAGCDSHGQSSGPVQLLQEPRHFKVREYFWSCQQPCSSFQEHLKDKIKMEDEEEIELNEIVSDPSSKIVRDLWTDEIKIFYGKGKS